MRSLSIADQALLARAATFDPRSFGISWHTLFWADAPGSSLAHLAAVPTLTDLSGNSRTASQGTDGRRFRYLTRAASLGGRPALAGPGVMATSAFTAITQPVSWVYIGGLFGKSILSTAATGIAVDALNSARVMIYQNAGVVTGFTTGSPSSLALDAVKRYEPEVFALVANGASSKIIRGATTTTGTLGSTAPTQVTIGNISNATPTPDVPAFANMAPMGLIGLYAGDITAHAGWAAFVAAARRHYHLDDPRNLIVCDGDSRTLGAGANPGCNWPTQLDAALTVHANVINTGVSGQSVDNMTTDAATQNDPLHSASYLNNVVVCYGGINDLYAGNSAATVNFRISTYCAARRTAGFEVVVCTIPAASTVTGSAETARVAVNTSIRANWATYADALADLDADTRLQTTGNTTYFNADGVHFTDAGYTVHQGIITAALATIGVT